MLLNQKAIHTDTHGAKCASFHFLAIVIFYIMLSVTCSNFVETGVVTISRRTFRKRYKNRESTTFSSLIKSNGNSIQTCFTASTLVFRSVCFNRSQTVQYKYNAQLFIRTEVRNRENPGVKNLTRSLARLRVNPF